MARSLIGPKIRERRRAIGATQASLAAKVGISASYLNLIEGNKRNIAGGLLKRIAEELGLAVDELDGAAERRLLADLAELSGEPLLAGLRLGGAEAGELAGRHADFARALVVLHRALADRNRAVSALSDRLSQDPFLGDAVHDMLTKASAIRSSAEILETVDDLEPAQHRRFVSIIGSESRRLGEVAQALAAFFENARSGTAPSTPVEEVDDFIVEHDNHFPELERAAAQRHDDGRLIEAILEASPRLTSEASRRRARRVLSSYAAAAALMPYEEFLGAARRVRYDIEQLGQAFGASFEQVSHRLVTLRRPGEEAIPFGLMRVDAAGFVSKRFPLPHLLMPRHGNACPLWAVYQAAQSPGTMVRQLAEFPTGDRFLFLARTVEKRRPSFAMPRRLLSLMLACDAHYADQTVYGDGLDLSSAGPAVPVGPNCRVCVRRECAYREEDPIIDA